ncbi:hypothetical protein ACA910_018719 [Epithemia clementina (nom. ined.)]
MGNWDPYRHHHRGSIERSIVHHGRTWVSGLGTSSLPKSPRSSLESYGDEADTRERASFRQGKDRCAPSARSGCKSTTTNAKVGMREGEQFVLGRKAETLQEMARVAEESSHRHESSERVDNMLLSHDGLIEEFEQEGFASL